MRTTVNVEQDALRLVRNYAEARSISLGQAVSDLIHRGAETVPKFKTRNGWVVFDVPPGTPAVTNEILEERENADNEEEHRRAFSPRR